MILFGVFGVAGIAIGIYELTDHDCSKGMLGIFLGAVLLFIDICLIIVVVDDNTETTEKVVGKGTIVTEIDINYFNGGKDNSNEIKYFIEVESGDKIILDKSEWDKIKDEYTYVPVEAEYIKEE